MVFYDEKNGVLPVRKMAAGFASIIALFAGSANAQLLTLDCQLNEKAVVDFTDLAGKTWMADSARRNGLDYFVTGRMPVPGTLIIDSDAQTINGMAWTHSIDPDDVGFRLDHRWWSLNRRTLQLSVSHLDEQPYHGAGWVIGVCMQRRRIF